MEQKEPVLVLYDREEEYARLFSEYLKRQKELPWQIHTYTRAEELLAGEKSGEVTMLVVAESSCEEALNTLQPTCQAILNESGTLRFHQFPNINKYQEAGQVWKELLALYVETTGIRMPLLCAEYKTRFIGMYSPVHRCLQSTFALTFAQLMAEKHPTLYLNFEHYVGIIELLPERQDRDLADLLYFLAGDFLFACRRSFREKAIWIIFHPCGTDRTCWGSPGKNGEVCSKGSRSWGNTNMSFWI